MALIARKLKEKAYAKLLAAAEPSKCSTSRTVNCLLDVFGTGSAVSQVLAVKREFSKDHIRRLAERFRVSPELYFGSPP